MAGAAEHEGWVGRRAVDRRGEKVGEITDVYVDDATGTAEWVTVATGWFGTREHFVPIAGAAASGDALRLDWDVDVIKDAPAIEPDGHLEADEERRLYRHYGFDHDAADRSSAYGTTTYGADAPSAPPTFPAEGADDGPATWEPGSPRLRRRAIGDERVVRQETEAFRRFGTT